MNAIEKDIMTGMISILNEASDRYYNGKPLIMTDEEFDIRLRDLLQFEEDTGVVFANSPTVNVGYKVLTELNEITHSHPMLSLEKCHTVDELIKFANNKELVASIKLDGLTVSLTYKDGALVSAETRGNGYVGSDIAEHIKHFLNVPLIINKQGTYIIDGEAIITNEDFAEINKNGEYKNSRNLAAGTLSVLDTSLVAQRRLSFMAWDVIEGGSSNKLKDNLNEAKEFGFDVVPSWVATNLDPKNLQSNIDYVFDFAEEEGLPCDGIVFKFNDIEYGKSLGATSHHFKNGIAYKRKDDAYQTKLIDVDWTMGKTGTLTPTAVFESVEIDGTTVERASLHNISIMQDLCLCIDDIIEVYKANQIIPQVKRNVSAEHRQYAEATEAPVLYIPEYCPICGGNTEIRQDNNSKVLVCTNDNCKGKLLGKLTHFVSKNAMNVDGLSEQTLEKFIELGWLTKFIDIYYLDVNKNEMKQLEGFGEKSVKNLLDSIERSRKTTLDRFIYALSIPDVGRSTAKTIASRFENYKDFIVRAPSFDWEELDGIGIQTASKIDEFIQSHIDEIREIANELNFEEVEHIALSNTLANKVFCITGSLNHFANRDEAKEKIELFGGKVSGSVSAKTSYLVNNDVNSMSGKNKKAKELGVKIISEAELIEMMK
jgi:DNA ligase (NAD+)